MSGFNLDELGLGLRTTGRAALPLTASTGRDLTPEDLALLNSPRESTAQPVKKLRERHHALARILAQGTAPGEAAIICGYSASRVSILLSDPAFAELVEFYRDGVRERYLDAHTAMSELHIDAVEELRERLEDTPEDFTIGHLLDVAKFSADRTGFGPSSKTEVNVKVGIADRLREAQKRVAAMRDITPQED